MSPGLSRRLRRALSALSATAVLGVAGLAAAPDAAAVSPLGDLQTRLLRALSGSTATTVAVRADVEGVGVVHLHSSRPMRPASTEKVFTAGTALLRLGPRSQFATSVSTNAAGGVRGGALYGDLLLTTSGDPTLRRADLDRLAMALRAKGVRVVSGALAVDATRMSSDTVAPGWRSDFLPDESGPVGAFVLDRNSYRSDAAFLRDPTYDNAVVWRRVLLAHGITVLGHTRLGPLPTAGARLVHLAAGSAVRPMAVRLTTLAVHHSARLSHIVAHMLKTSDNFYAETLLRVAGADRSGLGTRRTGAAAVRSVAASLASPVGTVMDGSGLSYWDRQTPDALVGWLEKVSRTPVGPSLRAALATSCTDGTLRHRLCGWGLTGRVHAKTGTLNGVRTLAGYTTTLRGRKVTFAIMLSGVSDMSAALRHIDAAVVRLATYPS